MSSAQAAAPIGVIEVDDSRQVELAVTRLFLPEDVTVKGRVLVG